MAFQVEDVKELKTPLKEKRHDLFQRPVTNGHRVAVRRKPWEAEACWDQDPVHSEP